MKLYEFQDNGVKILLEGFKKNRYQCLAWYTGSGKTNVLAELCKRLLQENPDIKIGISAYLTTEIKLQISERLSQFGLKDAVYTVVPCAPKYVKGKSITVFNPQGFWSALPNVKFDYIFLDEVHAGLDPTCKMLPKIIKGCSHKETRYLLVSATPWNPLSQKEWKDCPVFKRSLDKGLEDGLITDFKFHAEEANVEFTEKDFTRDGDLNKNVIIQNMQITKSACIGKMENILKKNDKILGKKVLVICPPGNYSEIARSLAEKFGGLHFVSHGHRADASSELDKFKSDPKIRFLFVTRKCQVGFDFQEMTSVIDLTMSRNIQILAQRIGRIARKSGNTEKHYFYIYDKSLMADQLEWLVATIIDFSLGAYDGWTTRRVKYRQIDIPQQTFVHPITTSLKEVIKALKDPSAIETKKRLAFVSSNPPTKWGLDKALKKASEYPSRTEMWRKNPGLYKWFRLNAKQEMDRIFPFKRAMGKWNQRTVEAVMRANAGMRRRSFNEKFAGARYWCQTVNPAMGKILLDKYLPLTVNFWSDEKALEKLLVIKKWGQIRDMGGLRGWMQTNGGEKRWRNIWMDLRPKDSTKDIPKILEKVRSTPLAKFPKPPRPNSERAYLVKEKIERQAKALKLTKEEREFQLLRAALDKYRQEKETKLLLKTESLNEKTP